MLAPIAALAGGAPRFAPSSRRANLATTTQRDLMKRIGGQAKGTLSAVRLKVGGKTVAKAVHQRPVRLDALDKRLKKVVVMASESVLVGTSGTRAAVLGQLPEESATREEATTFVRTLLKHKSITLTKPKMKKKKGGAPARRPNLSSLWQPTGYRRKAAKGSSPAPISSVVSPMPFPLSKLPMVFQVQHPKG